MLHERARREWVYGREDRYRNDRDPEGASQGTNPFHRPVAAHSGVGAGPRACPGTRQRPIAEEGRWRGPRAGTGACPYVRRAATRSLCRGLWPWSGYTGDSCSYPLFGSDVGCLPPRAR